jgi:hypothetical protein
MGENLVPVIAYSDIERMGKAISMSKLFGLQTPEQAIALMLIAQAEGLHPAIAARDYHIIQGRPALKADAMLSRFQAAGGKVQWTELTDKKVSAIFSHPQGGSVEIDWTMERAKQADLGGKDMWKKYPRQMLRARVISEGIRTVYPGCLVGFYTPEEVMDMEPTQPLRVQNAPPDETSKGNGHVETQTPPTEHRSASGPESGVLSKPKQELIDELEDYCRFRDGSGTVDDSMLDSVLTRVSSYDKDGKTYKIDTLTKLKDPRVSDKWAATCLGKLRALVKEEGGSDGIV